MALALVPEAVAFSFVAGVHPLVGLYAAFIVGSITAVIGGRPGMISGATGALAVVMVALVASGPIEQIPLAALIGVMFMVVIGTFAWQSLTILRRIPLTDALVMALVTVVTVMTDLAIAVGVGVGVLVSALAYAWNNATRIHTNTETTPDGEKIYRIEGPLFFGSVDGFAELFDTAADPASVTVDFANSRVVDQSALQAIEALAARYEAEGKALQLRHLSRDCHALLNRSGQLILDMEDDPDYGLVVD